MRLAFIVTEYPKTTETFIYRELVELHRRGHEIRLYHLAPFRTREVVHDFARPTLAWARTEPFLLSPRVLGVLLRTILFRPARMAGILGSVARGCRRNPVMLLKSLMIVPKSLVFAADLRKWQVDHVHAGFATHPATCAWIIGRMTGIPYSVSCHAHDIFVTQAMLDRKLGEAAFVRSISDFNRRYLREKIPALTSRPIEVIHIGLDLEGIAPLPPAGNEGFRALYVGSLEVRKGVDHLLRALARCGAELGDWRCDVMGDGPERGALERLAQDLGLGERLTFHGKQPVERICLAYADADVLVVPSVIGPGGRTEGIPTVLVEALAQQRPVIATNVSGIPELVRPGKTGWLVPPGDPAALAAALLEARNDPGLARTMAAAGRRLVEAEFGLSANVDLLLDQFQRAAALDGRIEAGSASQLPAEDPA